jgi:hypothetical protein
MLRKAIEEDRFAERFVNLDAAVVVNESEFALTRFRVAFQPMTRPSAVRRFIIRGVVSRLALSGEDVS